MTCPSCGTEVDAGRAFCPSCGTELRPAMHPRQRQGYADVQSVELALVPREMRAPTTWTIAKGVLLGLVLYSLLSAVVSATVFAFLLTR